MIWSSNELGTMQKSVATTIPVGFSFSVSMFPLGIEDKVHPFFNSKGTKQMKKNVERAAK